MKTLIYYHNSCLDGSTAAAIVGLAHTGLDLHYSPIDYNAGIAHSQGKPIDELSYKEYQSVIFVDFSPSEMQLANITYHMSGDAYKKAVIVLDHHGSFNEELYKQLCEERGVEPSNDVVFKSNVSGARLAYTRYLSQLSSLSSFKSPLYRKIESLAPVAQYVSDYDTWNKNNARAFTFHAGINSMLRGHQDTVGHLYTDLPPSVEFMMDIIGRTSLSDIMDQGLIVQANDQWEVDSHLETTFVRDPNEFIPVPHVVVRLDRRLRDLACETAMQQFGVGVAVNAVFGSGQVFLSVRSHKESTVTAKSIAQSRNGNGHDHSAGCQIPTTEFNQIYR